ncbi:hypothetical protein GCM10023087_08130 [Microbacterium rhizosphaerae]
MGVDIFFVLSGFLITSLLLAEHDRTGAISLRWFYARRVLRLYPALITMVVIGVPFFRLLGDQGTLPGYALTALFAGTYVQDFVIGFTGNAHGGFGHTWSLAVEEQFYLLWPILLILLLRRRANVLLWTLGAMGITTVTLAALSFQPSPDGIPDGAYFLPWSRFSALFAGCVVALLVRGEMTPSFVQRQWFGLGAAATGALLIVGASFLDQYPSFSWEEPAIAAASSAVVWHLTSSHSALASPLAWRPLAWLGRRSYGVYLYHLPVHAVLLAFVPLARSALGLLTLAVAIAVAAISYRYVELPFLRLKKRYAGETDRQQGDGGAPSAPTGPASST